MNKQRFPRIRFDGFLGDWEKKTLADVSIVERGKFSARPRNDPKFFGGSMPFIQTGDITNSDLFLTNYTQTLNSDGILVSKVFPQKTILITIAANIGDTAITTFDIACPDSVVAIRADENRSNVFFLKYILDLKRAFLNDCATQNAQKNINLQVLNPLEIKLCSLAEQTHLGLFFRRLDSQIAESRAVLEKSRQLKKAMLAKMFPANGEKIPKIRFKGFEGEWGTRSLRDVLEIERKGKAQYQKLQVGNVPYLDAEFLNGGVKILTDAVSDVDVDDILIIWDGSNAGKVYTGFNGVLGSTLKSYRTNADCSSMFLYQELVRNEEVIFNQYRTPNIPHVIKNFSDEYNFLMPSYKEQTAVGLFFRQLDETIALQSAEVEKLNQLKKGLLAAMLV
jgi:hsdS-type I specificity subunit